MGSGEFLLALLGTIDNSYNKKFSFKTKLLLKFTKLFFPNYIKKAAKTRLELKNIIKDQVRKSSPDVIIELGSGYSKDYLDLLDKKDIKKLIQIDKEENANSDLKGYSFIRGNIASENTWNKLKDLSKYKNSIIAEGLFSYLNNEEFDFVINKIRELLNKKSVLITHEPLMPISFSRKILSVFIGKTYRRFSSIEEIKKYYSLRNLKVKIINHNKWQVIYQVSI